MSNKQSSVDFYAEQSLNLFNLFQQGQISINEFRTKMYEVEIQSTKMHKEEMIEFGNDLLAQNDTTYIAMPNLSEQYYNQLFGGNK